MPNYDMFALLSNPQKTKGAIKEAGKSQNFKKITRTFT